MGNISLARIGGACAILMVVSGVVARIFFGSGDIVTGHVFDVLALLLFIAVALGLYQALHEAGATLQIAVVAILTGIIFLLFHEFIRLGIAIELTPAIADASTDTRPALEVMANTLRQISQIGAGVGYILIFVIGLLLFSFAVLRTSVVPKWIGWLGFLVVAAHVVLLTLLSDAFSSFRPSWLWPVVTGTTLLWLVAIGVVLLRLRETKAPDSVT